MPIVTHRQRVGTARLRIVAVTGPPCSGKSTLARAIAEAEGGLTVDIDEVRDRILPSSSQSHVDRDIAYRCVHLMALKLAQAGVTPIVLAATYARRESREALRAMLDAADLTLFVIECRTTPEHAVMRFRKRMPGHPAIDLHEERVEMLARDYPYGVGLPLDTTVETADSCLARIRRYLGEGQTVDMPTWTLKGQCASPASSRV